LDKAKVTQALRRLADEWAADPQVLAVLLFGSHAKGEATGMSDADVLIILAASRKPFHERIPGFLRSGVGLPLDVFPYTLDEVQSLQPPVVTEALRNGIWLVDKVGLQESLKSMSKPEAGTRLKIVQQ